MVSKRDWREELRAWTRNSRDSAQRGRKRSWSRRGQWDRGPRRNVCGPAGQKPVERGQSEAGIRGMQQGGRPRVRATGSCPACGRPARPRGQDPGEVSVGAKVQCQGRPPDGEAFAFPGAESGEPRGRVCGPPPEPHPPSGRWRPRESGRLFPRKGVQDPHQLLSAPGAPKPSSPRGSPAQSPAVGSWHTAGVQYVSRPAGHASWRGRRGGDSGGPGTLWGGALSRPPAAPGARAPPAPGAGRGRAPDAPGRRVTAPRLPGNEAGGRGAQLREAWVSRGSSPLPRP